MIESKKRDIKNILRDKMKPIDFLLENKYYLEVIRGRRKLK
jgi:hypothetical protein